MTRFSPSAVRRSLAVLLLLTLTAAVAGPRAWADPTAPRANDRQIAKAVTQILERQHLLKHPLDTEISERCFNAYLKALDPWKLYFYQSDVDEFAKQKGGLSEAIKNRDVNFAYAVFKVFLQRIDERVKVIDGLLDAKHDFTVDEQMVTDKDAATYAKDPAEAKEKWRKRIKYDLLVMKADKTEGQEAIDKLHKRYQSFAKRMHQTDEDELLEMYLSAYTSSLDPHSSYMAPFTLKNFELMMKLELEGIGAALQALDGETVVQEIMPGGAAEKEGRLKAKDKIVGVGEGPHGEIVDTADMKLNKVVQMIRGRQGTIVRLAVVSPESPEKKIISITRAKIELTNSEARSKIFDEGRKSDGAPYKVGVIDLPSFYMDMDGARQGKADYKSVTRDVRVLLEDFKKKGVDLVVLDLRRNGGGSLPEAVSLSGLFIEEGPVVQVKDLDGRVQPYYDFERGMVWSGPLIVVTSKFSASASEILAGAIQDYGRGLIVGDRSTHGKGTVQQLLDVGRELFRIPNAPSMGGLKITIQQFYRPLGDSTQRRGVLADIELPSLTSHLDVGEADLDYALPFDKVDGLRFKRTAQIDRAAVDHLRRLSEERCKAAEKFQQVRRSIERYEEQKARKAVTLNEEKFLKERAEMNTEKEEEKKFEELNETRKHEIVRDYYLGEVMAIGVDFLGLKQLAKAK